MKKSEVMGHIAEVKSHGLGFTSAI